MRKRRAPRTLVREDRLFLVHEVPIRHSFVLSNTPAVPAGTEWKAEIDRNLEAADLILLLVTADFLASNYCWDIEAKRAMERHEAGEAKVVPIILRTCDWTSAPFSKLPALPKDALPVSRWPDEDDAWADVAQALRRLITA
jgi:hypothetical protein